MIRPTGIINFAVGEWAMVGAFGGFLLLSQVRMALCRSAWRRCWPSCSCSAGRPSASRCGRWWSGARRSSRRSSRCSACWWCSARSISVSFPPDPHPVPYPFGLGRLEIGPLGGSYQSFFIIAVTLAVFAGAWLFLRAHALGPQGFEAVALNRRAAALMGINLSRVTALSFAGGAGVAGPRRPAGLAQHLGALPDGRAARHPGLHRAGDRRRGARRRARCSAGCCSPSPSSSPRATRRFPRASRRACRCCS